MDARKCTTCPNAVTGNFKTCLSCRLYKRAAGMKHKERTKKKREAEKASREKKPWTQEKWEAFVQGGGLEGL